MCRNPSTHIHTNTQTYTLTHISSVVGTAIPGTVEYVSLAINPSDGSPYLAYKDNVNSYKLSVKKFASGAWSFVGAAGFSAGASYNVHLAFSSAGIPYVAYPEWVSGSYVCSVQKFESGAWTTVGSSFYSGATQEPYLFLAIRQSDSVPYVAYTDVPNSYKLLVKMFDGTSWVFVGPSTGISTARADYINLVFKSDGTPLVSFRELSGNPYKATVLNYVGGSWVAVGTPAQFGNIGNALRLALTSSGVPYVSFGDGNANGAATVMYCIGC
jgi:hypothetical protein